jgi:hypothetical protein
VFQIDQPGDIREPRIGQLRGSQYQIRQADAIRKHREPLVGDANLAQDRDFSDIR